MWKKLESGQYVSLQRDGNNPQDNTRYVSWAYDGDTQGNAVEKTARGKIISLHLQKNNVRTKVRIDLSDGDGDKVVNNFIHLSIPANPPRTFRDHDLLIRVLFREVLDDSNEVVEHRIGGRYYRTTVNDIFAFAAVVKKEVGSVVFLKRCENTDRHASCDLSSGGYQTSFYDSNGNDLASAPHGVPSTLETVADYRSYVIRDFYDGQTEADYFDLSFDPH